MTIFERFRKGRLDAGARTFDIVRSLAKQQVDIAKKRTEAMIPEGDNDRIRRLEKITNRWEKKIDVYFINNDKKREKSLMEILQTTRDQTQKGVTARSWRMYNDRLVSKLHLLDVVGTKLPIHDTIEKSLGPDLTYSDPHLVELYHSLLHLDPYFKLVARAANSGKQIILKAESLDGQDAAYYAPEHTIYVPLYKGNGTAKPLEAIQSELLFELHNATRRDAISRISEQIFPHERLNEHSSPEEKEQYHFKMAAYALAMEWGEWISGIEFTTYKPNIGKKESGSAEGISHQFSEHLQNQIRWGHTSLYDSEAGKSDWVGKDIMAIANDRYLDKLSVTQEEVKDWQQGKSTKIKSAGVNPFLSLDLIEQARQNIRNLP